MLDVSFSKFPRRTGISFSEGLRKIISRTKATGLPNLGDALFRIQQLMVREGKLRSLLSTGQGLIRNGCRGHLHRCLPFHDPETGKTGRRPSPRAAAGALCISAYDTLSGLKPLEEMKKMIDQGWPKANGTLPLT